MVDGHPRRNAQIIPVKSQRDNGANASPLRRKRRAITPCSSRHYTVIAMPQCRNGETAARLRRPRNPMNVCSKRRGRPLCRPLRQLPHGFRPAAIGVHHHPTIRFSPSICYFVTMSLSPPRSHMFLCCSVYPPPRSLCFYVVMSKKTPVALSKN